MHGELILAARMQPDGALFARIEAYIDIPAGGWQDVDVGDVGAVDVSRIQAVLATDAIGDANLSNDTNRPSAPTSDRLR